MPATDRTVGKTSILAQFQIISKGLLTNKMIVAEFLPRIIFKQAAQTLLTKVALWALNLKPSDLPMGYPLTYSSTKREMALNPNKISLSGQNK